jgi:hypothetical protein
MRHPWSFVVLVGAFCCAPARADSISGSYTELPNGTLIDLTAQGTLDWAKFGNGENGFTYLTATKIGNPVLILPELFVLGPSSPPGLTLKAFSGGQNLLFTWSNGNFAPAGGGPVDTAISETYSPAMNSYPIGIGATFSALAGADTRILDVYVFGFDSDMLITAVLSGGASTSTVVSPSIRPPNDPNNDYALGVYEITYSGAGETLNVSVLTQDPRTTGAQNAFANAGIFAAAVREASPSAVPEPASAVLLTLAAPLFAVLLGRRGRRNSTAEGQCGR